MTLHIDGELVDMHQDFIIRGQTEHTIALQHHLKYDDHLPDARPRARKRGRQSTQNPSEKYRRAAGRGRGRRGRGQPALGSAASRAVAPAVAEPASDGMEVELDLDEQDKFGGPRRGNTFSLGKSKIQLGVK